MGNTPENVSGSFPNTQTGNSGALQVNVSNDATSFFDPNAALSAVNTYLQLNNVANRLFGLDARWFRAIPQQRSQDVMFKEYTLSNVAEEPLCLKVLLPDGNFPESQYNYDLMGLEYEVPLTIHVDKKYWEEIAGFGTAPQKKDIVYLTLPNKLYQVESSFLDRGFMEQETAWVVNLTKYQTEASRRESDDLKETIDQYTVGEEEIFGELQENEQEKITNPQQFSQFNSTERDQYKILDEDLVVMSQNVEFFGLIAAESFYDMSTSDKFTGVSYEPIGQDNLQTDSDRAVTAWIRTKEFDGKTYDVKSITKDLTITVPANYKIQVGTSRRFQIGETFVVSRPGALNFYAEVIDDGEAVNGIYYCKIDEDVEDYLASVKGDWTTARNYKMQVKAPVTVINGVNETDTGFRIRLFANQFVRVDYGNQTIVTALSNKLLDEKWYGIVVNIGNTWGQYNVNVWEEWTGNREDKLRVVSTSTMKLTPEKTLVDRYTINKGEFLITNIRLFHTTIEEEKQAQELLSYFSKDADQAIILDNADPKKILPYVSRQR